MVTQQWPRDAPASRGVPLSPESPSHPVIQRLSGHENVPHPSATRTQSATILEQSSLTAAPHARARIRPVVRRRSELPEVWRRDVGQSRREAQSQGAGLQVQGPKLRRGDLATPGGDVPGSIGDASSAGTTCARRRDGARGKWGAPAHRVERGAYRRCRWPAGGLGRHAALPDLRRRDVGRPRLQAQSARARLQVPQQASRARRARLRGGDLAGERWLAEPVPAFDRATTGSHSAGRPTPLGGAPTRRQAAAGRRRSAVLGRRLAVEVVRGSCGTASEGNRLPEAVSIEPLTGKPRPSGR